MQTTIDRAGRVVIPKLLRQEAGLRAGMALEVRCHDGRIEIEPATLPVQLVREGPLLVAVPLTDPGPLTAEEVERTREQLQRERETGS